MVVNTKLIHDDFLNPSEKHKKFLMALRGRVDLVLTDPPFNIADKGKVTKVGSKLWSNAEAWGDTFKDKFEPDEYDEFITAFLRSAFVLLKEGGSLVTFIDDKYAGVLTRIAEDINVSADKKQPRGFVHKKNIHFFKTNPTPRIRQYNYTTACEVAVWLVKPRSKGSSPAKPEIFNYESPQPARALYADRSEKAKKVDMDVRQYHSGLWSNVFLYRAGRFAKISTHPCQKYVEQIEPLVKAHSNEGSLVLDPFFGGGTTAVVCRRLGRDYVGFEIEKRHYKEACGLVRKEISAGK